MGPPTGVGLSVQLRISLNWKKCSKPVAVIRSVGRPKSVLFYAGIFTASSLKLNGSLE